MMVKEYRELTQQKHMRTERVKIQYVRKKKLNVTIKCNKKNTKMFNFDYITKEDIR